MKIFRRALLLALAAVCLWPWIASGANPRNPAPYRRPTSGQERILRFQSLIEVHPDASLTVTENLKVQTMGWRIKRGIVRDFPTTYRDKEGRTVKVGFEVLEVLKDGKKEPYHLSSALNGVKIYIGQKDVRLPPGVYTYTIKYRTDRQLGFFKDYDELYWNVTGNAWAFPIDRAQAVIELPPGAKILQSSAYTGRMGARGRDYDVRESGPRKIIFNTTKELDPGSGLTVAVAWPKGVVRPPSDADKVGYFLRDYLNLVVGGAGLLMVLGFYLVSWSRVGQDPEAGTIIPLFAPPPGFSPGAVRNLMRMGFDDRTVAAALVDMAVKGYLTIENIGKEYTLHKRGRGFKTLSRGEQNLGSKLFSAGDTLEMKNKNHSLIQDARDALKNTLKRELEKAYFVVNSNYLVSGIILSVLTLGAVILASLNQSGSASTIFWLFVWIGAGAALALWSLNKWGSVAETATSVLKKIGALGLGLFAVSYFIVKIFTATFMSPMFPLIVIGLALILVGMNLLFYRLLKSPTLTGRKVMDQIEGFKLYLSVAEKERLNLLNPPERTPELFEKYLPYALALDVENEWSEQFATVLAQAGADGQGYTPTWYYGGSYHDVGSSRFVSNLGGAFAGAISSSATAPGSSSGSGGGGFSGGGGGGGGGGGW
ncbi:MAG: DUF2207 domain-containing protein [Thermodesulfobacteriota bacterium]